MFLLVPEERLELSPLARHDFESCAATITPLRLHPFSHLLSPLGPCGVILADEAPKINELSRDFSRNSTVY